MSQCRKVQSSTLKLVPVLFVTMIVTIIVACSSNESEKTTEPIQTTKQQKAIQPKKTSPITIPAKDEPDELLSPRALRENGSLAARTPTPLIESTVLMSIAEEDPKKAVALFSQAVDFRERNFFLKAEVLGLKKKAFIGGFLTMKTHSKKYKLVANVSNRVVRLWKEPDTRIWREGKTVILDCSGEEDPKVFLKRKTISIHCSSIYPKTIEKLGVPVDKDQLLASPTLAEATLAQCKKNSNNRPCYHLKKRFARNFYKATWRKLPDNRKDQIIKKEKALW